MVKLVQVKLQNIHRKLYEAYTNCALCAHRHKQCNLIHNGRCTWSVPRWMDQWSVSNAVPEREILPNAPNEQQRIILRRVEKDETIRQLQERIRMLERDQARQ